LALASSWQVEFIERELQFAAQKEIELKRNVECVQAQIDSECSKDQKAEEALQQAYQAVEASGFERDVLDKLQTMQSIEQQLTLTRQEMPAVNSLLDLEARNRARELMKRYNRNESEEVRHEL
jgi:hypothetical protein